MVRAWERLRTQYPEASVIIQAGIDKLEAYRFRVTLIPEYTLAMSPSFFWLLFGLLFLSN